MNAKKILYIIVGCISVGLGAVGAVLPILPTVPFLMLAGFCFARSSQKLDTWFKSTKLYKKNLETYVKGQGMTWKTKIKIISTVTILMSIGFVMMKSTNIGRIILVCVWILHITYFCFGVKTLKIEDDKENIQDLTTETKLDDNV